MSAPADTQARQATPLISVPPIQTQNPNTGSESSSESELGDDRPTDVGDPKTWDRALESQVISSTSKYDAMLGTDSSATQSPSEQATGGQSKANVADTSSDSNDSEGSAGEDSGQKVVVRKLNKEATGSNSSDSSDEESE
ncbi:hypothetical protein BN14_11748 [Rhizoctonia solani AG-1 IB]|uniref:Uncharacterized protein n=1 Tax=Thanatephorus cucumeris (strain AG1-IB / isolate 7/3/14) TaxID=1108050 RepID=M5CHB8_THACB|nr:hypothetical protein BN14_11748 [Rhizoctonia solani AG-1 IB]